jgi:hypothetical protein
MPCITLRGKNNLQLVGTGIIRRTFGHRIREVSEHLRVLCE